MASIGSILDAVKGARIGEATLNAASKTIKLAPYAAGGLIAVGVAQGLSKPVQELIYGYEPSPVVTPAQTYYYNDGQWKGSPTMTSGSGVSTTGALGTSDLITQMALLKGLSSTGTEAAASTGGATDWKGLLTLGIIGIGLIVVAPPLLKSLTKK